FFSRKTRKTIGGVVSGGVGYVYKRQALEHDTAAVYEIMIPTKTMQEFELQVVAAKVRIAKPEIYFTETQL
ncbi:hypothetical protein ACVGW7_20325, partial [Enterobacter intestinihominis]